MVCSEHILNHIYTSYLEKIEIHFILITMATKRRNKLPLVLSTTVLSVLCALTDGSDQQSSCPLHESAMTELDLYAPHHDEASSPCRPKHLHLSVGVTPWDSMTVSFSVQRECDLDDVRTILRYAPIEDEDATELELDHDAHVSGFDFTSTKQNVGAYKSDHLFHVPLTDLESSLTYHYRVEVRKRDVDAPAKPSRIRGVKALSSSDRSVFSPNDDNDDDGLIVSSPTLTFSTTAPPGSTKVGTKMAIVADLGQTYNATMTMLHMYMETLSKNDGDSVDDHKPASIVLCGGDCAYADANPRRWDSWFDLIEPLVSRVPLQVAVGNHEVECDAETFDVFTPYEHRFRMPNPVPSRRTKNTELCLLENRKGVVKHIPSEAIFHYDYGNSYYGFTHGITHVVVLNCYAPSHRQSRQYAWLLDEFRGVDRNMTPWLLVMVHCPLYNTFTDHTKEFNAEQMLKSMEDLFLRYRVNLVTSGHAHGYSRSRGVARNVVNDVAPIYIVVGEGGCREGHSVGYRHDEPEPWLVRRDNTEFGFGTVDFLNSTIAHWKWVRNVNVDEKDFTDEVFIENQWLHEFENEDSLEVKGRD